MKSDPRAIRAVELSRGGYSSREIQAKLKEEGLGMRRQDLLSAIREGQAPGRGFGMKAYHPSGLEKTREQKIAEILTDSPKASTRAIQKELKGTKWKGRFGSIQADTEKVLSDRIAMFEAKVKADKSLSQATKTRLLDKLDALKAHSKRDAMDLVRRFVDKDGVYGHAPSP